MGAECKEWGVCLCIQSCVLFESREGFDKPSASTLEVSFSRCPKGSMKFRFQLHSRSPTSRSTRVSNRDPNRDSNRNSNGDSNRDSKRDSSTRFQYLISIPDSST